MNDIEMYVKKALSWYKKDGCLSELLRKIVDVMEDDVHSVSDVETILDAITKHCPPPVFECIYYDGENGRYHLFDFDPNLISRESLLIEVRSRLKHEIGIELDYIDKAMESVYLLNSNTLVKVI